MTRQVFAGRVAIGGGAPVSVQTMTNTDTRDVEATLNQIHAMAEAGADIVRVSVYDEACAEAGLPGSLHFTVDWKTPTAGEAVSAAMRRENYELLDTRDAVKFVVGTENDLAFMECCADEAGLWDRCAVLVSPVWGAIEPAEIAAYLIDHGLDRARLQLQLHKIIWPDETRGV